MAQEGPKKAEFGPHPHSPRDADARAPGAVSSPWRRSFDDSMRARITSATRMGGLQSQTGMIEGIAGADGAAVVSLLEKTCTEKVSPLGEAATCAFIGAVLAVSLRAAASGRFAAGASKPICDAAEKLGRAAERLGDGKAFVAACSAVGVMPDLFTIYKCINYMLAASMMLKPGMVSVQAAFIAERARGMVPASVDKLLESMLERLNEIAAKAGEAATGGQQPAAVSDAEERGKPKAP